MRGLRDKVALVAGGGSGIGAATAARLAEEGAAVVVGDIVGDAAEQVAAGIRSAGGRAAAAAVDVSDEASVAALVRTAVDTFGGLDVAHINAADMATLAKDSDALEVPLEVFDRTIAVNLRGHLLCTRAVLPELLRRGGGALVYTTSGSAFIGEPVRPSYAIAKSGLTALTRHVASAWGPRGVRANAVAPGLVQNVRVRERLRDAAAMAEAVAATRSTRVGEPEDIAAAVTFLLSDDASWINGQVLSVDGGSTLR